MTVRGAFLFIALTSTLLASCADEGGTGVGNELGVRVQWLTGDPAGVLPDDVQQLRILLWTDGEGPRETLITPASFELEPGGRPYAAPELLKGLPAEVPLRIRVEASAPSGLKYIGHVGPLVLGPGERRYVDLKMYEIGVSTPADVNGMPARFLQTATPLPDGRVLIAGGFTEVTAGADCPAGAPADTTCFEVTASNDAWIFDPTGGRFYPVAGGMLAARAGHTATTLPGGRVLVAGGAESAVIGFVSLGDPAMPRGYDLVIEPAGGGPLDSFELFFPEDGAEAEDLDRDGDPGRGGFRGAADDASSPGRLNDPRFLHAAAPVPGEAGRVLLVGGMGTGAAGSWEVFDDQRAGGYGPLTNDGNTLGTERPAPAAVALADDVWIFGGAIAQGNADLAEIWSPDGGNGDVTPASDTTFPDPDAVSTADRPELALMRPSAAPVGDGTHAVVVGWFGPRCAPGSADPIFATDAVGSGTEPCGHSGGPPRNFTVNGAGGATVAFETGGPHAFASIAPLSNGQIAVSGGIANLVWTRQASIEVFTGVIIDGMAELAPRQYPLTSQRALHTTATLPNEALVSVGGINLSRDLAAMTLVPTAEVHYLLREPTPSTER